ncbi:MAG: hypothetical protein FD130_20 [Halothiobacillaceae bacterium]|nr:MAG: hypothetical protein FD130_20 [Halothiobacillaceae bacterium]
MVPPSPTITDPDANETPTFRPLTVPKEVPTIEINVVPTDPKVTLLVTSIAGT